MSHPASKKNTTTSKNHLPTNHQCSGGISERSFSCRQGTRWSPLSYPRDSAHPPVARHVESRHRQWCHACNLPCKPCTTLCHLRPWYQTIFKWQIRVFSVFNVLMLMLGFSILLLLFRFCCCCCCRWWWCNKWRLSSWLGFGIWNHFKLLYII